MSEPFKIGDRVMKIKGYQYYGEVRAVFHTSRGDLRYVVENTGENLGMLFIFNQEQLAVEVKPLNTPTKAQ